MIPTHPLCDEQEAWGGGRRPQGRGKLEALLRTAVLDGERQRLKTKDWLVSRHSPLPRPLSYTFLQCQVFSVGELEGGQRIEGYCESYSSCVEPYFHERSPARPASILRFEFLHQYCYANRPKTLSFGGWGCVRIFREPDRAGGKPWLPAVPFALLYTLFDG